MRLLMTLLVLANTLTAVCDRGSRLISEAGGAAAIAGTAASQDAPSLAGVVGISDPNQVAPFEVIPTLPGAPGILDFADFYALMPTDNPDPILANGNVKFPRTGSTNGTIQRVEGSLGRFLLTLPGTYLVLFQGAVTEAGQLMLQISDNEPVAQTVVGRSAGNTQIVGFGLVTTHVYNVILEVINPAGNNSITLTSNAGGNQPVSAHLVIIRIQ